MQKLYNGSNITIISNNCLAGVIYNILSLEFCSPTINQWMKMAEYYEFVSNLKYYMQCELVENVEESKNWKFPVGTLIAKDTSHNNLNIYILIIMILLKTPKQNGKRESKKYYGISYM